MTLRILAFLAFTALMHCCAGEEKTKCAQVDCLIRRIPLTMIKDMMRTLKAISKSLPSDTRRYIRYLPKLCKKKLNIADIDKVLGIYEDHVFKKLWTNDIEYPMRFTASYFTLKVNVEHCMVHSGTKLKPSRYAEEKIKDMEEAFKKLQPEELYSAMADFETVLHWISYYTDKRLAHNRCQTFSKK